MHRRLRAALNMLGRDPAGFLKRLAGTFHHWKVFCGATASISGFPDIEGAELRKLSDEELETAIATRPLTEHQILEFRNAGFNGAYGVFHSGRLGHISWVMTREVEHEDTPVGLREGEAEITFCVTFPDSRGLGLYPFAISRLCGLLSRRGIHTVFMKTSASNQASQRGITKAGLRPCGSLYVYETPFRPARPFVYHHFRKQGNPQ